MNMLNDLFPNKFCINLDRRPDRWIEVQKEFSRIGLTGIQRWPAVDGQTIPPSEHLMSGEIGCTRSHSGVMKYCLDNNIDEVLIFEDDIIFSEAIQYFNMLYQLIPQDWDMIYLGGNHTNGRLSKITDYTYKMTHSYAMHGYMIKKRAMEWMVKECEKEIFISDVCAANYHSIGNCYTFLPVLAYQKADFSDIQQGFRNYDYLLKIGVNK